MKFLIGFILLSVFAAHNSTIVMKGDSFAKQTKQTSKVAFEEISSTRVSLEPNTLSDGCSDCNNQCYNGGFRYFCALREGGCCECTNEPVCKLCKNNCH